MMEVVHNRFNFQLMSGCIIICNSKKGGGGCCVDSEILRPNGAKWQDFSESLLHSESFCKILLPSLSDQKTKIMAVHLIYVRKVVV